MLSEKIFWKAAHKFKTHLKHIPKFFWVILKESSYPKIKVFSNFICMHMYIFMCVGMYVRVHMHVCAQSAQKPDVSTGCLAQSLSTSFYFGRVSRYT